MNLRLTISAALAFGAASLASSSARAANPDCTTLPTPVWTTGSTAVKPVLGKIAPLLAAQTQPVTVIYLGSGSCAGVSTVLTATPITGTGLSYWDATGAELKCDLAAPGVQADVGLSDVFADTCQNLPNGLPSNVVNYDAFIQAMTFVVPNTSMEKSISAEAAFYIFGFGTNSGVMPWNDETSMFIRSSSSGTQQMISAAITVPAAKWKGVPGAGSSNVLNSLITAGMGASAAKAIGILSADVADPHRDTLRVLAYQHFGQNCGYLPDSASNKFDKRNVRDGHYAIWGPLHALKRTDIDTANQQNIQKTIDYLTGAQEPPGVDLVAFEAQNRVVPQCAMRVKRTTEVGPMVPFTPTKPCGCYYEFVANTTSECKSCQKTADCPSGYSCPLYGGMGFCEPP